MTQLDDQVKAFKSAFPYVDDLAFNPAKGKFYPIDRTTRSAAGWHNRMLAANRAWQVWQAAIKYKEGINK